MKKIINILSYILNVILITASISGSIYFIKKYKDLKNNINNHNNTITVLPNDENSDIEDEISDEGGNNDGVEEEQFEFILDNIDIPILKINGDTEGISKDNKVNITVEYSSNDLNFNSNATLKWQGSSSLGYDKKNYTLTLLDESGEKIKLKSKTNGVQKANTVLKLIILIFLQQEMLYLQNYIVKLFTQEIKLIN